MAGEVALDGDVAKLVMGSCSHVKKPFWIGSGWLTVGGCLRSVGCLPSSWSFEAGTRLTNFGK